MEKIKSLIEALKPACFQIKRADQFFIVGHRGACALEVENTIPSFAKALELGANALEIDVSFTKDNIPVIWHDFDPFDLVAHARRLKLESNKFAYPEIGDEADVVAELTLERMRAMYGYRNKETDDLLSVNIPTLEEFLVWSRDKSQIDLVFLDIKITEEYIDRIPAFMSALSLLFRLYPTHFPIVLMTPRADVMLAMKQYQERPMDYTLDIELPPGVIATDAKYSSVNAALYFRNRFASIGLMVAGQLLPWGTYKRIIKYEVSRKDAYPESIKLFSWTINDTNQMKCLINLGVDGIVTDNPALLAQISNRMIPTTASGFQLLA